VESVYTVMKAETNEIQIKIQELEQFQRDLEAEEIVLKYLEYLFGRATKIPDEIRTSIPDRLQVVATLRNEKFRMHKRMNELLLSRGVLDAGRVGWRWEQRLKASWECSGWYLKHPEELKSDKWTEWSDVMCEWPACDPKG
jgi:hypothetical protein